MAQLGHFSTTVLDSSGNAVSGATVTVYREGATFQSGTGTSPVTLTVRNNGKIVAADTVFINTTTGTTYTVDSATDTQVVLSGFGGTLSPTALDRIVPSNNPPSIYADDQGGTTAIAGSALTTSATGFAGAYTAERVVDYVVSGTGVATTLFEGVPVSTQTPGLVRYADDFIQGTGTGGIQEAINDLPSGGGVVYISTAATTTATITIADDVTVQSTNKLATITKGFNGNVFTASGNRCRIKDVYIDGAQATRTGHGINVDGATDVVIDGCTVDNNASYGILVQDTSPRARIFNNHVVGNESIGIFVQQDSVECIVRGNYVDCSQNTPVAGAHAIALHGTDAGETVSNCVIADNFCKTGGSAAFCIEFGGFVGDAPTGITCTGNTCVSAANGSGGISAASVAGATHCTIAGNSYDDGGFTMSVAAIELGNATFCSVTGNTLKTSGSTNGINCVNSSDNVIQGNTINGLADAAANEGIFLVQDAASKNVDRNVIANNVIKFNASGAGIGIRLQANSAGGTCDDNSVIGNIIDGNGAAADSIGIKVSGTAGTLSNNLVANNSLYNLETGISTNAAAGLTQTTNYFGNVMRTVTTAWSADSIQAIAAAGNTLWSGTNILQVTVAGGGITLTSTPTLADGFDTQIVTLVNVDTTDTLTIQDQGTLGGSNLRLSAATIALGARDSIQLMYSSTVGDWVQIGQSNVT